MEIKYLWYTIRQACPPKQFHAYRQSRKTQTQRTELSDESEVKILQSATVYQAACTNILMGRNVSYTMQEKCKVATHWISLRAACWDTKAKGKAKPDSGSQTPSHMGCIRTWTGSGPTAESLISVVIQKYWTSPQTAPSKRSEKKSLNVQNFDRVQAESGGALCGLHSMSSYHAKFHLNLFQCPSIHNEHICTVHLCVVCSPNHYNEKKKSILIKLSISKSIKHACPGAHLICMLNGSLKICECRCQTCSEQGQRGPMLPPSSGVWRDGKEKRSE